MTRYILGRLFRTVLILVGMTLLVFLLTRLVPGDPARLHAGLHATEAQVAETRQEMGLDEPIWTQYSRYMSALSKADLGVSFRTRAPVTQDLIRYFPATLELVGVAMLVTAVMGVALGILSAYRAGGVADQLGQVLASATGALPVFWLAILLQLLFFFVLGILPASGRLPLDTEVSRTTGLLLVDAVLAGEFRSIPVVVRHLALPVLALVVTNVGVIARVSRRSILNELSKHYSIVALSKGFGRGRVLLAHSLRNALNPIITLLGIQFGYLLTGAVLVEAIFGWPGVGLYAVQAARGLDYPAIMGVTIIVTVFFTLANLAVDVGYMILDPRVREGAV